MFYFLIVLSQPWKGEILVGERPTVLDCAFIREVEVKQRFANLTKHMFFYNIQ